MTYTFALSLRAEADVQSVVNYLLMHSHSSAEEFYRSIDSPALSLTELPNRGPKRRFSRFGVLRRLPVEGFPPYIAFYKVYEREKHVLILKVIHGARDLESEL